MECVKCGRTETAKWYSPKTNPTCASCYRKEYVARNPDKVKEYFKKYNASDKARQARKEYEQTEKGQAARKKAEKKYYTSNPEKMRAKRDNPAQRERLKAHYRRNKGYYSEKSQRRKRQMDKASLHGQYREATVEVYCNSPEGYEIDHIIPLIGKDWVEGKYKQVICGLHVPWNLQYLPKRENRSKSSKFKLNQ